MNKTSWTCSALYYFLLYTGGLDGWERIHVSKQYSFGLTLGAWKKYWGKIYAKKLCKNAPIFLLKIFLKYNMYILLLNFIVGSKEKTLQVHISFAIFCIKS